MRQLMGIDVPGTFTFNASARTVTFTNLTYTLALNNIILINNATANTIIYNFTDATAGAVSLTNNVLTLDYNTTPMSNSDKLMVYIDIEGYDDSWQTLFRRMNKLLESNGVVDSALRQRIAVEVMPTTTVTGTVVAQGQYGIFNQQGNVYGSSNTNVLPIAEGPVDQRWRIIDDARSCYAAAIRSKLTFS